MAKFEVYKDKKGNFRFRLKANNGQTVIASEAYTTKTACNNGISSVRMNSTKMDRYDKLLSKNGKVYFNLKASNGQVIGTSEIYSSRPAMENGIRVVREVSDNAEVVDLD
mgnify:CR=1 FL=1